MLARSSSETWAQLRTWILTWIVVPNILFVTVSIFAGGPPLYPQIILTGLIGFLVRRSSYWLQLICFMAATLWSAASFIAGVFRLTVRSALEWAPHLLELQPFAASEYVAVAGGLAATILAGAKLLRYDAAFDCKKCASVATLTILSFAGAEAALATAAEGSYDGSAGAGTPFTSGVKQSRFLGRADGQRHLVLVMVEAMGLPTEPMLREKLFARWQQADIRRLYDVRIGTTPFYGSTTHGEIRALCGRWSDYSPYLEGYHADCLPAQLRAKGYRTTGIHSFSGSFFNRTQWYRNVGFEKELFRDDLLKAGVPACGGVFPGACDPRVPAFIGKRLQAAKEPQFIYWLTVNSHLPVVPDPTLKTKECREFPSDFATNFPSTCRLFKVLQGVNDGLASMATDPELPPTDILISGDHAPPFLNSSERALFDKRRVPWILLRRKGQRVEASPNSPEQLALR